jgi:hypothetical protein
VEREFCAAWFHDLTMTDQTIHKIVCVKQQNEVIVICFSLMMNKTAGRSDISLVSLCRDAIVANLERYNVEAFQILDESEWENIVRRKHEISRPLRGKGGLDGTGRMNPAVNNKFLFTIEETLPHLATSKVVDNLVWKDNVNHKFRAGGLSRPKGLMFPYPVLEARIKAAGDTLADIRKKHDINEEEKRLGFRAIKAICDSPMDVGLLESSGIGKTVQKFVNTYSKNQNLAFDNKTIANLSAALECWKIMARTSGVLMKDKHAAAETLDSSSRHGRAEDLEKARQCKSWRELFFMLRQNDETRRENQGARMRERRLKLNSERPKIVKVRHKISTRHETIVKNKETRLGKSPAIPIHKHSKIQQLRAEAKVTSARRSAPMQKVQNGFGAAVAFATGSQKKRKTGSIVLDLAGGKRMKIPNGKPPARDFKKKDARFR